MFYGGPSYVSLHAGLALYELILPSNFEMEFNVYVTSVPDKHSTDAYGVLMTSTASGEELFRLGVTASTQLQLTVNGVDYMGPFLPGATAVYTKVLVNMGFGKLGVYSEYDGVYSTWEVAGLPANVDTKRYVLYASAPGYTSAGGCAQDFNVRRKCSYTFVSSPVAVLS
jgi:hypothetical protein